MRIHLAISVVALAVATFATPSEAQSNRGNGISINSPSRGISQGSFSNRNFSNRSINSGTFRRVDPGSVTQRRTFRVRPPSPGSQVSGNQQRRSFRIQPPSPGNQVAGNQQRRSFRIQPPAPGNQVAGNRQPRSFRIQPPTPGGRVTGSSFVPAAAAVTAAAGTAAVASSRPTSAATAPAGNTAVTTAPAAGDRPPAEMLARVGAPIEPLAKAPEAQAAQVVETGAVARLTRVRVRQTESCNVPSHRRYGYGRRY